MIFLSGVALGIVIALAGMCILSVWLESEIDDRDEIQ